MFFKHSFFLIVCWSVVKATGALMPPSSSSTSSTSTSRRAWLGGTVAAVLSTTTTISSPPAWAAADCFQDCQKNCRQIAPKDPAYCLENCRAYCDQPDRTDGLSGSVSASSGEVGILGGTFGQGTVVKGEDKPPSLKLPGLDFSTGSGKKLLGIQ